MHWYRKISADASDFSPVADALDWFQTEYEQGREELKLQGRRIDAVAARLPGLIEYYYAQYQELETILSYFERLESKAIVEKTQWYMTSYNRTINENTARKYAEVHDDVMVIAKVRWEVANCRNNFLALFKAIEAMHYQVRNVVLLRTSGFDDALY